MAGVSTSVAGVELRELDRERGLPLLPAPRRRGDPPRSDGETDAVLSLPRIGPFDTPSSPKFASLSFSTTATVPLSYTQDSHEPCGMTTGVGLRLLSQSPRYFSYPSLNAGVTRELKINSPRGFVAGGIGVSGTDLACEGEDGNWEEERETGELGGDLPNFELLDRTEELECVDEVDSARVCSPVRIEAGGGGWRGAVGESVG